MADRASSRDRLRLIVGRWQEAAAMSGKAGPIPALFDRARDLVQPIRARAAETELRRDIPTDTIAEIVAAGLFRAFQPREWGGLELDPRDLLAIQSQFAEVCPSTAWVYGVLSVQSFMLAHFPYEAQADVWGNDPETLVCSSFMPAGRATRIEGGYEISGRWTYSSGCRHAGWAIVGAMLTSDGDGQPAEARLFLIPRSDYSIIDTWRVIGLRGTGSNDLFAEKIFVPAHRAIASTPGLLPLVSRTDLAPLYRLPWLYVFTSTISAIGIGMGRGALRAFMEMVCSRPGDATHGGKDDPRIRDLLGRTISELDMIEALVQRNFGDFVSAIQERREMPIGEALRSRSQLASILRRIAGLVDEMMLLSGARGIREESPLRRFWLDLCAARAHAGNDPTATLSRLADVCSAVI